MKKVLILFTSLLFCALFASSFMIATHENKGACAVNKGKIDSEYDLSYGDAFIKSILFDEDGISCRYNSDKEALIKSLKAEVVMTEYLPDMTVTDYYSPYIRRYVNIGNKRVNMQIAVDIYGNVTIGSPLLCGSY